MRLGSLQEGLDLVGDGVDQIVVVVGHKVRAGGMIPAKVGANSGASRGRRGDQKVLGVAMKIHGLTLSLADVSITIGIVFCEDAAGGDQQGQAVIRKIAWMLTLVVLAEVCLHAILMTIGSVILAQ